MLRLPTLMLCLLGSAVIASCNGSPFSEAAAISLPDQDAAASTGRIHPVEVSSIVITDSITYPRQYVGRVVAGRESDLGFEVSGRIESLTVNIGDQVQRGDVIGRVSVERRDLAIQEAEARKDEVEARLVAAEESLTRIRDLAQRGFATQQELDETLAARDALVATLSVVERQIALNKRDRSDTVLRAPFAGSITARLADQGVVINAGQAVVTLLSDGGLEADIGIPPSVAQSLEISDAFTLQSRDQVLNGTVLRVGREVDTATRTVAVRLALNSDEATPGLIVPGDLVTLSIPKTENVRAAKVPLSSLNESWRGLWSVYIVDGDQEVGVVNRKDVEIVAVDDQSAYIRGTIANGDRLITATTDRVVPGQTMRAVVR
ncbi:MAG: efflux RND transporter periplasmic adaptor subunit [Pseudomonadota bacterium]